MKTLLRLAILALLVVVTGAVLVGVYDVHRDLSDVHALAIATEQTVATLNRTLATVDSTMNTVNAAADEERNNWAAASREAAQTGNDTRRVVAHLDRILTRINTTTLDGLDAQVKGNGDKLQTAIGNLGVTAAKLGATADGLTELTRTADAKLNDPQIPILLGHFNTISGNLEIISANSAAMSADMKVAVHRLAKPPTKLHTALDVAWTTAKFGSLFIP